MVFSGVESFSPVREEEEKERGLRRDDDDLRVRFEEEEDVEKEGIFNAPIAAIVAIVVV